MDRKNKRGTVITGANQSYRAYGAGSVKKKQKRTLSNRLRVLLAIIALLALLAVVIVYALSLSSMLGSGM